MNPLVELLQRNARLSSRQLAERLGRTEAEVETQLQELMDSGAILGFNAVVDQERVDDSRVSALIEVRLTPERGGGFDRLAARIAKFDQVIACYLMSGGYDLAVTVEGDDLREIARFVSENLSTIEGVLSTATHFQLKVYKESGFLASEAPEEGRLAVTP
ncbi:MAG: Lrp/AsnC family transcriptional regulator [Verrucomicrobiota bacterium]